RSALTRFSRDWSSDVCSSDLARVDCDKEPDLAMQFGVQSLPTVMLIKQGRPVDGFAGVETEQAIRDKLAPYLPKPEDELLAQAEIGRASGRVRKCSSVGGGVV